MFYFVPELELELDFAFGLVLGFVFDFVFDLVFDFVVVELFEQQGQPNRHTTARTTR